MFSKFTFFPIILEHFNFLYPMWLDFLFKAGLDMSSFYYFYYSITVFLLKQSIYHLITGLCHFEWLCLYQKGNATEILRSLIDWCFWLLAFKNHSSVKSHLLLHLKTGVDIDFAFILFSILFLLYQCPFPYSIGFYFLSIFWWKLQKVHTFI